MNRKRIVISFVLLLILSLTACSNTGNEVIEPREHNKIIREDIWQTENSEVVIAINPSFYITDRSLEFYAYWVDSNYKTGAIQVYGVNIDGKEYNYTDKNRAFYQQSISNKSELSSPSEKFIINRDNLLDLEKLIGEEKRAYMSTGVHPIDFKEAESIQLIAGIFDNNLNKIDVIIDFVPNKLTADK